ncbi:hypothetical protein HYV80_03845 [Candidatus Woesearchaeota archaeon]|nr:hypothetical protein [Candidatus Woesearchaeota archaeon]
MVKLIGVMLIVSSLLALAAGALIDMRYNSNAAITGNVISAIIEQPTVNLAFFDYIEAFAVSYSVFSFIMGVMFLFKM